MGLPLAVQFARHGWDVTAVDVNPDVRRRGQRRSLARDRGTGLAEGVAEVHAAGRLRASRPHAAEAVSRGGQWRSSSCRSCFDVRPPARTTATWIRRGVDFGRGHAGLHGDLRDHSSRRGHARSVLPRLEARAGLVGDKDLFVAFSPERLYSGAVFANLATYPKARRGIGPESTRRAAVFLRFRPRRRDRGHERRRGGRVQQARRHHLPRREHRPGQRVSPASPIGPGWSIQESRRPTANRTRTSTSRVSASADIASPYIRTCCSAAPPDLESWRRPGGPTTDSWARSIKTLESHLGRPGRRSDSRPGADLPRACQGAGLLEGLP